MSVALNNEYIYINTRSRNLFYSIWGKRGPFTGQAPSWSQCFLGTRRFDISEHVTSRHCSLFLEISKIDGALYRSHKD